VSRLFDPNDEKMLRMAAEQHGLPYVDLYEVSIPPEVASLLPEATARKCRAVPLAETDGKLTIAVCDPNDYDTFDEIRFILNRQIEIVLATEKSIHEAISRHYLGNASGGAATKRLN
jgi:type IV pilus assembly protein PilB